MLYHNLLSHHHTIIIRKMIIVGKNRTSGKIRNTEILGNQKKRKKYVFREVLWEENQIYCFLYYWQGKTSIQFNLLLVSRAIHQDGHFFVVWRKLKKVVQKFQEIRECRNCLNCKLHWLAENFTFVDQLPPFSNKSLPMR